MARSLCAVLVLSLAIGCKTTGKKSPPAAETAKKPAGPIEQIEAWEDQRSLGGGALLELAKGPDAAVRARAQRALARIQDPATTDAVVRGMADPEPAVRGEALFAAGQFGLAWDPLAPAFRDALVGKVLEVEAGEADPSVRLLALEALGKLGAAPALERLADRLVGGTADLRARAALSLGVAAKRAAAPKDPKPDAKPKEPLPARAFTLLSAMLKKDSPPEQRFAAAYALAMSRWAPTRPALLVCTQDELAEVRALCAKGLGEVGTEPDAVTLKKLLSDPDYRVAVEATRALAKLAGRCKAAVCPAVGALSDLSFRAERYLGGDTAAGGQPLLALAKSPLPAAARPLLTALRASLAKAPGTAGKQLKADLAYMDCRLAAAMDRQAGKLQETLSCGGNLMPEAWRLHLGLSELAEPGPGPRDDVSPYLLHADPRVKLAALEVIAEHGPKTAAERVRGLVSAKDLVVAAQAAETAGKVGDEAAVPAIRALAPHIPQNPDLADSVAGALVALKAKEAEADLRAWLTAPNAHVRTVAAQALGQLAGQPVDPLRVDGPDERKPALPKGARLTFKTERGDVEVQLYADEAPRTAGNLFQLAKKGFFRRLTFHRIEPDFVVQGGDPRGDGNGGPGYVIRCEMNDKPYLRGVVGMALSGKDTGGSQFFITTSPQPHLEGRYTAFGQVTQGMEIVDSLLEDDRILEVVANP